MLRQTSNATFAQTSHTAGFVRPLVRILRLCTQMQQQVNRYH